MAAQKRLSNRNYIDLVADEEDERRAAARLPASIHPLRDYLRSLVAAMRRARSETDRPLPPRRVSFPGSTGHDLNQKDRAGGQ